LLGIGAGESQTGQAIFNQTPQTVIGGNPIQTALAHRSQGCPGYGILNRDFCRIVQGDDGAVALFLVVQPTVVQRPQNRGEPGMIRGDQGFDQFGFAVEIGVAQLRQCGLHCGVIGGVGGRNAK